MRRVNVHEAKSTLSALLAEVEDSGEVVLICRAGKPVAELRKVASRVSVAPHPDLSRIRLHAPAEEPLDAEDWGELG